MFLRRADGRELKTIDPFMKIIPYIMRERSDAMVMKNEDYLCDPLDQYILDKRAEGNEDINYMSIIISAMVRSIAEKPQLNRFVMNGKMYARHKISAAFAIHRSLRGDASETTVKPEFEGTETIFEVSKKIREIIQETRESKENDTDVFAKIMMWMPSTLVRATIAFIRFLDRHSMIPGALIQLSPFHTTFFITNLKSIGLSNLFHHIYNFGTCSIFVSLGKEEVKAVVNLKGEIETKKVLTLGWVNDERITDGLYYSRAARLFRKYMENPALLEEKLEKKIEDIK